jgi:translation initiation factor 3 subunit D
MEKLSSISLQSLDYWGPPSNFIFDQYRNLPFAPFNKLEKISKACDFTGASSKPSGAPGGGFGAKGEEEDEYIVVEASTGLKKQVGGMYNKTRRPGQPYGQFNKAMPQAGQLRKVIQPGSRYRQNNYQRTMTTRTKFKDNAGVQTDWVYIIDAAKLNFEKAPVSTVTVKDLLSVGSLKEYDRSTELKATPKKEQSLTSQPPSAMTIRYGLSDDRVFEEYIKQDQGTAEPTVYATDAVLSAILTVKNSVFPWDVRVKKVGNQIILDQSEQEKSSYIDMLSVNENTTGNLPEEEKDLIRLCIEATYINKNFNAQVAKGEEKTVKSDKIELDELPEEKLYKYRKYTLDGKYNVIVRAEVDSYARIQEYEGGERIQNLKLFALNEFDLGQDWRAKLDTNRGALESTEFRNNSCKISKWLCQSILADVDTVKLGFVSRVAAKDSTKHSILLVETIKTDILSKTIGYKLKENWSIIKHLVELILKQEDGTYVFVKLPYKQAIRIYRIPKEDEEKATA